MPKLEDLKRELQSKVIYRNATLTSTTTNAIERSDAEVEDINEATFILISNNNETERFDWWEGETYIEELDIKGADFSTLKTFFKDHNPSVDNAIGKVENLRVDGKQLLCEVVFGSDPKSQEIKAKYAEGILTDVSIGYRVNEIVETKNKDQPNHILVTDFEIVELSAVWKGADAGAIKIKSIVDAEPTIKRFSHNLYEKKFNRLEVSNE